MLLAGCGGSGSGTESSDRSESSVGVFFTDTLSADYDQVWVTTFKVELTNDSGKVTLLEIPEGQEIDVRSLAGAERSEFLFMGSTSLPKGTYTKILITVARNAQIFAKGSEAAVSAPFSATLNDGDRSRLEVTLDPPLAVTSASHDLVIDFDLAAWKLEEGTLAPVVKIHPGTGLEDLNRQRGHEYRGILSGLTGTAPEQTFILGLGGKRVQVVCSPETKILAEGLETDAPALTDGSLVEVKGRFDILTRSLRAQSILIKSGPGPEKEAKVKGAAKEANEAEGTFATLPLIVRGFIPSGRSVKVTTSDATKFMNENGRTMTKAVFFSSVKNEKAIVESLGMWLAASSTFSASSVRLESADAAKVESSAIGTIKTANKEEGFFVLLAEGMAVEGFALPVGVEVKLKAVRSTIFRDSNGSQMTRDVFFEKALAGLKIKGIGSQSEGTINCRLLEFVEVQPPVSIGTP